MTRLFTLLFAALLVTACSTPAPPMVAAVRSDASTAELQRLINSGASLEARDSSTWSPLELAAFQGDVAAINLLLDAGANINAEDGGGRTPLYFAADNDHREAVRVLLSRGASMSFRGADSDWPPAWVSEIANVEQADLREAQRLSNEEAMREAELLEQQRQIQEMEQRIAQQQQRDAALPPQIQRDKYLVAFSNAMKELRYPEAVFYANLLERTGLPVDDSLYYFWGEALLEVGETDEALSKLATYLNRAGNTGQYYTQTLSLMLEAESR